MNYDFKESGAQTFKNGKWTYEEFPVDNPYLYKPGDNGRRYPRDMAFPSGTFFPKRKVRKRKK